MINLPALPSFRRLSRVLSFLALSCLPAAAWPAAGPPPAPVVVAPVVEREMAPTIRVTGDVISAARPWRHDPDKLAARIMAWFQSTTLK